MPNFAKGRVLVGVDSPYRSQPAIATAIAQARRLGTGVTIVHVFVEPIAYGLGPWVMGLADAVANSRTALKELATQTSTDNPGIDVQPAVVVGSTAEVLINLSREAKMIVLGCRGLGGFAELMLGSVSSQVAAHAHCPVLVLRPADAAADEEGKPVIVGVDGSPASESAVGWAFAEADARKARLIALHCWSPIWVYAEDEVISDPVRQRQEQEAALLVSQALAGWREKYPDVTVEERAAPVIAIEAAMVNASTNAGLMVVGSRGRGGFTGLALGSVSQALLHHGHCPVLVARP
jgi:nucleotide-binding universal stress UspA family protein